MQLKDHYQRRLCYRIKLSMCNKTRVFHLGSVIEIKPNFVGCQKNFLSDDSIRNLLGFNAGTIYEKFNLSPFPVDILSFGNNFFMSELNNTKSKLPTSLQIFKQKFLSRNAFSVYK